MNVIETTRKKMNLTQCEIAQKVKISRQYYNKIENGKRIPSVNIAKELAEVLGISWTIFFADSVNK